MRHKRGLEPLGGHSSVVSQLGEQHSEWKRICGHDGGINRACQQALDLLRVSQRASEAFGIGQRNPGFVRLVREASRLSPPAGAHVVGAGVASNDDAVDGVDQDHAPAVVPGCAQAAPIPLAFNPWLFLFAGVLPRDVGRDLEEHFADTRRIARRMLVGGRSRWIVAGYVQWHSLLQFLRVVSRGLLWAVGAVIAVAKLFQTLDR